MRDWKDVNEVSSRSTGDAMYIQPIAWYTAPSVSLSTEWQKIEHGVSNWLRCMSAKGIRD